MRARWGNVARGEGRRTVVTMRLAPVVAVAGTLLLSACGSGGSTAESPAPVESVAATGAVAADGPDCPVGPPARGPLNKVEYDNDGIVGTIYNEASGPIWVKFSDAGETCRIQKGQSAVFAAAEGGTLNMWSDKNGGRYRTDVFMEDRIFSGILVRGPGPCRSLQVEREPKLGETFDFVNTGVTGLNLPWQRNREQAAREYTGVDSMYVDDWVRLDFRVKWLQFCSD